MKLRYLLPMMIMGSSLLLPGTVRAHRSVQSVEVEEASPLVSRLQQFDQLFAAWTDETYIIEPGGNANNKVVYLTFDDGPDPQWTPLVLEQLARHHAKATFFVIGRSARSEPQTILSVAEAGQMIGNHGYNHISLADLGWTDFYLELGDTNQAIRDALADKPELLTQVAECMRPPYGEVTPDVYAFAYRMHYDVSFWSLDTMDWSGISAKEILDTVLQGVKPGSIILMHDGPKDRGETAKGLGLVLHELTLRGYSFPSLCTADGQVIAYP
jgi:peptidoglycan/xylan/chitin deacetylase (PgdA/CDA1 family)